MMRSLYSAISGLKNHQIKMDVIGNNIANVNTPGYKRSTVTFATMLSQNLKGASSSTASQGGTNPMQIGMGAMVGSINQIMTDGSPQSTGNPTDLALQGTGFFVLKSNGEQVYTRAGGFNLDGEGNLEDPSTGAKVQGFSWGADDSVDPDWGATGDIKIQKGDPLASDSFFPITETTEALNTKTSPIATNLEDVTIDGMTKVAVGTTPASGQFSYNPATGAITFASGFDPSTADNSVLIHYVAPADSASHIAADSATQITVDYPPLSGSAVYLGDKKYTLTSTSTPGDGQYTISSVNGKYQITFGANGVSAADGTTTSTDADSATISYDFTNKAHTLDSYTIDQSGIITGVYNNGTDTVTHKIGQIEVASFANSAGLQNIGGNFYTKSNNSGDPSIGAAGQDGRATITSNSLEMSNVDLSQEMTDMITAQRGFQANSRVITVSDSLLQELIDLKRQ